MKTLNEIKIEALSLQVPIIFDDTASFLSQFIIENKPNKILEIGTGTGYSAFVILSATNNSQLTSLEINSERFNLAKNNLKSFGKRVTLKNLDAINFLKDNNEKFDLIFLDGPKGQYSNYLKYLLEALNDNGCIIADNIYFHGIAIGKEKVTKGMRSMIKGLHNFIIDVKTSSNLSVKEYEIGDGILVIKKEK